MRCSQGGAMELERKLELEEPLLAVGDDDDDEEGVEAGGGLVARRRREKGGGGRVTQVPGEEDEDDGAGAAAGMEVKVNGVNHERSVYFDEDDGLGSTETAKVGAGFTPYVESNIPATEAPPPENGKLQMLPTSSTYSEASYPNGNENNNMVDKHKQVPTPYEDKQPLFAIDVERVLEEQDTHDLYCPNCNSCITKRVILRKRKRTVRDVHLDAKRERIQPIQTDIITTPDITETTDGSHDQEPDVFRCLSCFSFFISTDGGFRLFRMFGKKEGSEDLQAAQPGPARDSSWIFSCFEFMGGKKETGSGISEPKDATAITLSKDSKEKSEDGSSTINNKDGQTLEDQQYRPAQRKTKDYLAIGFGSELIHGTPADRKEKQEPVSNVKQGVRQSDENSSNHLLTAEAAQDQSKSRSQTEIEETEEFKTKPLENRGIRQSDENSSSLLLTSEAAQDQRIRESDENSSSHLLISGAAQDQSKSSSPTGIEETEEFKTKPLENRENETSQNVGKPNMSLAGDILRQNNKVVFNDILTALNEDSFLPDKAGADMKAELHTVIETKNEGDGIISSLIDVNKPPHQVLKEPSSEQPIPVSRPPIYSPRDDTRLVVDEGITTESRGEREWDVLKAIVYGGLIEAITSLGVISSASGGDAGTLNIVALGMANLVGGLFLIIHNLFDLRNELNGTMDGTDEVTGRYWNLLGRRGHFKLHMTAALISFIVVGILPPAIYGFAFRKSDNKEYKLIIVAAASLTCIALLAIAKAHVQRSPKPYVKNLFYYLGLGLTVSGLSYVAGIFIHRLLEQLGLFDNSSTVLAPVQGLELITVSSPWI